MVHLDESSLHFDSFWGKNKPKATNYLIWLIPLSFIIYLLSINAMYPVLMVMGLTFVAYIIWRNYFSLGGKHTLKISKKEKAITQIDNEATSKIDFSRINWFEIILKKERRSHYKDYHIEMIAIVEQDIPIRFASFYSYSNDYNESKEFSGIWKTQLQKLTEKEVYLRDRGKKTKPELFLFDLPRKI